MPMDVSAARYLMAIAIEIKRGQMPAQAVVTVMNNCVSIGIGINEFILIMRLMREKVCFLIESFDKNSQEAQESG